MGLEKPVLIKSYIRQFLAMGYGTIKSIKFWKGYRAPRDRISNIKSRRKRREHCSRKLGKRGRKEERLYFTKPKNRENQVRSSVRYIHVLSDLGPRDTGYMPYSSK